MFSSGIEMEHWIKMDEKLLYICSNSKRTRVTDKASNSWTKFKYHWKPDAKVNVVKVLVRKVIKGT